MKGKQDIRHPLFGTSLSNWIRLLSDHGGVDKGYFFRAAFITVSVIFFLPARLLFKTIYSPIISKTKINKPPIFIIGHWRSGTTYLHELMSNDPQFCYVSLWQTLVPGSFLILNRFKSFFSQFLPAKRPMDEIMVDMDSPYEEEAALASLDRWSFFHCFIFPRNPEHQFHRSVLFEDMSSKDVEKWKKTYLNFIKAVTYENDGKQIIIKNPANTSRIKVILDLFPDAHFIHIYRNPYKVYVSTKNLRNRLLGPFALQDTTAEDVEQQVIDNYIQLMNSFFEQRDLIPEERLVEIRYEDLIANPLEQIEQIYSKLGLSDFYKSKSAIQRHIDDQINYKTNVYKFDKELTDLVEKNWGFTIKRWGYEPPKMRG